MNEEDYRCRSLLAAVPIGRRLGRGVGVVAWRMCFPAYTGNEVSCSVDFVELLPF